MGKSWDVSMRSRIYYCLQAEPELTGWYTGKLRWRFCTGLRRSVQGMAVSWTGCFSPVSLARSFMCVCMCLLGREHSLGRPIPNLISSQAVRSLRVNGDTWMQDPLGDFRMACQPRWGCPGLSPNWFHPATVGVGERFLSLVEKVLPKNSSILE